MKSNDESERLYALRGDAQKGLNEAENMREKALIGDLAATLAQTFGGRGTLRYYHQAKATEAANKLVDDAKERLRSANLDYNGKIISGTFDSWKGANGSKPMQSNHEVLPHKTTQATAPSFTYDWMFGKEEKLPFWMNDILKDK